MSSNPTPPVSSKCDVSRKKSNDNNDNIKNVSENKKNKKIEEKSAMKNSNKKKKPFKCDDEKNKKDAEWKSNKSPTLSVESLDT
jgi:hypothetical protein